MLENICELPCGRALVEELMAKAENGLEIRFNELSSGVTGAVLHLEKSCSKTVARIDINFRQLENVECAMLVRDGQHYAVRSLHYPPFITVAHEMVHALHFLRRWEQLQRDFLEQVPALNAGASTWQRFLGVVINRYQGTVAGLGSLQRDGLRAQDYQAKVFQALAAVDFVQNFHFSPLDPTLGEEYANTASFWNDNQEEESLTIAADPHFNDNLLLEQARTAGLVDGWPAQDPFFRWGHTYYHSAADLWGGTTGFSQGEFDAMVGLFNGVLPVGLRAD
jgi:hypothetical protein